MVGGEGSYVPCKAFSIDAVKAKYPGRLVARVYVRFYDVLPWSAHAQGLGMSFTARR